MNAQKILSGMILRNTNSGFIRTGLKDTISGQVNWKPHAGNNQNNECLMRKRSQPFYCSCMTIQETSKRGGFRVERKD